MPVLTPSVASQPTQINVTLPLDWQRRATTLVNVGTVIHALAAITLLVLLCGVSEDWWFSAALSYLPRAPYLAFSLLAIPAVLLRRWIQAAVNILCGLLIAGPVMGLCAPVSDSSSVSIPRDALLVVSCNIQNGDADLPKVLAEFDALQPDIIALQEARRGGEILAEYFADWNTVHVGEYWVSSRFPLRFVAEYEPDVSGRETVILCEIDTPSGTFLLCDVHLNTARHGLTGLRWHSVLSGAGVDDLRWRQWERRLESAATLKFVDGHSGLPILAVGDFNTPTSSSLFRDIWSEWQSAFDTAGWGYGFTSPCNTNRLWPGNTPWLRIDHILCDRGWRIHSAGIGRTNGSDHRLVWSRVSLQPDRERKVSDLSTAQRD
jgi:endonuclease/exonuclease/phosphatase family metal-dependent hydrolase